ncbi:MAG: PH domain-containing protein [Acidimicrobiia bacterium]
MVQRDPSPPPAPTGAPAARPAPAPAPSPAPATATVHRLDEAALWLRRLVLGAWLTGAALVVVLGAVAVALVGGPVLPLALVAAGVLGVAGGVGWWFVGAGFRSWAWLLDAERLEVRHGVVVQRRAIVPRSRVQHVSTNAGPLQRAFGLVRLDVHTAGARTPTVTIRDLRAGVADALRASLLDDRAGDGR